MKPFNNHQLRIRCLLMILLMLSTISTFGFHLLAGNALAAESADTPAGKAQNTQQSSSAGPSFPSHPAGELVPPPPMPGPASAFAEPSNSLREEINEALLQKSFTYEAKDMVDPFVSFIAPAEAPPEGLREDNEELSLPPVPQKPLTPLQKMSLSEIEKGLKAITWGDLGRKAVIEDAAGKGYIVTVGTPAGDKNGVITEIFNDGMVIQQESWDKKLRRMVPQNSMVKLRKEIQK